MLLFRKNKRVRRLALSLGVLLVTAFVLVLGFHRFVVKSLPGFLRDLANSYNASLSFDTVEVRWRFLLPEMCMNALELKYKETHVKSQNACVSLKVVESLTSLSPVLKRVSVLGFDADFSRLVFSNELESSNDESGKQQVETSSAPADGEQYLRIWKKLQQTLSDFELLDGRVLLPIGNGDTLQLNIVRVMSSIELEKGVFSIELRSEPSFISSILIEAAIKEPYSLEINWDAEVNNFEIPLVYIAGSTKFYRIQRLAAAGKLVADLKEFDSKTNFKEVKLHDGSAVGEFSLKGNGQGKEYKVSVGSIEGDAHEIVSLLDPNWIGAETVAWIRSNLQRPRATGGEVLVIGDSLGGLKELKVGFNSKIEEVSFSKNWPVLKHAEARFDISQHGMAIKEISAVTDGLKISSAEFSIPEFSDKNLVSKIALKIKDSGKAVLGYLANTPLAADAASLVGKTGLTVDGIETKLEIALPLVADASKKVPTEIKAVAKVSDVKVEFGDGVFGLQGGKSEFKFDISLPEASPVVVIANGDFSGTPTGRLKFSKFIYGKFSVNTGESGQGLRLAVGDDKKLVLPTFIGVSANSADLNGELKLSAAKKETATKSSKSEEIDPRILPNVDLSIKRLRFSGVDYGTVQLKTANIPNGLKLTKLDWISPRSDLRLNSGAWTIDSANRQKSSVEGVWRSNDVGAVLDFAGVSKDVAGGQGEMKFNLNWPGSFADFSVLDLKGVVTPALKNAELKSTQGVLLKLADLFTLNLLQAYKKGATLKDLNGSLHFNEGVVKMSPLLVDLGSIVTRLNGVLDLEEETINSRGEMNAEIGKAVGALTVGAFNPIAGVAYLAREKPFVDLSIFNRLTEFSYKIDGPWLDPKVSEVRYKPFGL